MKALISTLFTLFFVVSSFAQAFPSMETENLNEQELSIPEGLKGKFSIIGLAYSKKSEKALTTWFSPAYNQFMREPSKTDLFATSYDINLYFVPMFSGHKTVAYKSVMRKMQETIDQEMHPHVLFYKGSLKEYKKELTLKKDEPYFFLLDDEGNIVWRTSGFYSSQKFQEVVDHFDDALGEW